MEKPTGALVTRLVKDGPATKSDLKVRDVILSVNKVQVADVRDLMRQIGENALNPPYDSQVSINAASRFNTTDSLPGADRSGPSTAAEQTPPHPRVRSSARGL